jgi:hypothetical protein
VSFENGSSKARSHVVSAPHSPRASVLCYMYGTTAIAVPSTALRVAASTAVMSRRYLWGLRFQCNRHRKVVSDRRHCR